MKMNVTNICPFSFNDLKTGIIGCREKECAWWVTYKEKCSIVSIAESIDSIEPNVSSIETEVRNVSDVSDLVSYVSNIESYIGSIVSYVKKIHSSICEK